MSDPAAVERPELYLEAELDAQADWGGVDPEADGGQERVGVDVDDLERDPGSQQALDADGRRVAERDLDTEVGLQGRLDHLLHVLFFFFFPGPDDVLYGAVDRLTWSCRSRAIASPGS